MLLSELLRPDLIKVNLEAEKRDEALAELVDVLVQSHEISYAQRHEVLTALLDRESELGSGMEHGIAVPEAACDHVEDILCVLGTTPRAIAFETLDGKPVHLILVIVTPRRNFSGKVRTLACVSRLLEAEEVVQRIVTAPDAKAAYDVILEEESVRICLPEVEAIAV